MENNNNIETRGRPKNKKLEAIKLLQTGSHNPTTVSEITGLSLNRVYEIRKELNNVMEGVKEILTPKEKTDKPKLNYISENFVIKKDNTRAYIKLKIGESTDLALIEYFYKTRKPILLEGATGCGKSSALRHFANMKKIPYARVNLNGNSRPEELIGQFIPDENKTGFKWQDGLLTTFIKNGGLFVIDEINAGNPEMLFFLHSLTDDERQIVLTQKDGEIIKAHPDFFLACSMNPDYEGTKPLNEALKRRFQIIKFDYNELAEKKYVKDHKILDFASKIRTMVKLGEITTPLATDHLIEFETMITDLGYETASIIFLNRFKMEEEKSVKETLDLIMNSKKDKQEKKAENNTQRDVI